MLLPHITKDNVEVVRFISERVQSVFVSINEQIVYVMMPQFDEKHTGVRPNDSKKMSAKRKKKRKTNSKRRVPRTTAKFFLPEKKQQNKDRPKARQAGEWVVEETGVAENSGSRPRATRRS